MIISRPNEDGVVFVTGEQHQYFVLYNIEGEICPKVETGREIFNRMDMSDCYAIDIERLWIVKGKYIIECRFRGTHHDRYEHLKMKIEDAITGEAYDIGYGSDH